MSNAEASIDSSDGTIAVDLTDPELYRHGFPHALFDELRRQGPVLRHERVVLPTAREGVAFWAVIGHPEVQRVDRDWQIFSAEAGPGIAPQPDVGLPASIVTTDGKAHTRLRKLINAGFTPRMIRQLSELCARRIDVALDAVIARGGECEFVHDVAFQVPMHMIADIVGIPEDDRPLVFGAIETMWRAGDPKSGISRSELRAAEAELYSYAHSLGAEKRARPVDDVWSILTRAEIETEDGERAVLQDGELEIFFMILTLAGSETTTNAISQGLVALIEHPDQLAALRADRSLLDSAMDEILRWVCPVTLFGRVARKDVELGGRAIAAGERVTMWYPSANRDERVFENASRFDITRRPNPHVSFGGGGPHYCMGANLARLEMRTVFDRLLDRFAEIEITGPAEWDVATPDRNGAATLARLPVRLSAKA